MRKETKENLRLVTEEDMNPYLEPRFHSVGWRFFIYFFFISLMPIFIIGFSMVKNAEFFMKTEISNKFELIVSSKLSEIELALKEVKDEFGGIPDGHPELLDDFSLMVEESDFEKRDEARTKLTEIASSSGYFTELSMVHPQNGKIIVSTNRLNEGTDLSGEQYFKNAKGQIVIDKFRYTGETEGFVLNIALPFKDQNDTLKAVLTGKIDLDYLDKLFATDIGLGLTGEMYIAGKTGRIITGIGYNDHYRKLDPVNRLSEISKYKKDPIFTEGMANGLKGMEGILIYDNYTGREVIGYFKYAPKLEAVILAEESYDEALALVNKMKADFGWILLFVLAIDIIFAFFAAYRIAKPLQKLADKAQLISKGDYEVLSGISSYDEFGILAQAFNKMSEALVSVLNETRNIIDVMPSALFIIGINGKINSVNQSACRLTEHSKEALTAMYFDDLIGHYGNSNEGGTDFDLKQLEKSGVIANAQQTFFTKSHHFLPVSISGAVLKNKKNKTTGFVVVIDDLTQIKESEYKLQSSHEKLKIAKATTEQEKAKAETLLASIGDGIIALGLNGNIMTINQKTEDMFGKTSEEVVGKHYSKAFRFEDEKGNAVISNIFSVPGSIKIDRKTIFFLMPNNQKLPLSITVSPVLFEDKPIGNIVTLRDITKETEVDKAKSEFVSLASHQLRTPLTGIKWLLSEITRRKNLDDLQTEYLKDADESTERMINLVNDLLNVSRLETGTIKAVSQNVNLFEFLSPIVKEAVLLAKEKNQEVRFIMADPKLTAALDPQLIGQVVTNLLSNAICYTDPNKSIIISAEKDKKKFIIKIKDEGIGISKDDRKKIFRKFFRTKEAGKRSTTGSGLGLYIVGKILEVCSGTIECESEEGKGTTFTVILPLKGPVNKASEKTLILKKLFTPLKKTT